MNLIKIGHVRLGFALLAASSALAAVPAAAQSQPVAGFREDAGTALTRHLRTLSDQPRNVSALSGAGRAALELGDAQAALTFFARAEEIAPRDGRIKAGMASAFLAMEEPRTAMRLFEEAAALGVPAAEFAGDRGLVYDLSGDPRRAQADYMLALSRQENDEVRRRLALSQAISGERDKAIATIDAQLRRQDRAAWRTRAFILALAGDARGATQVAESMLPLQAAQLQPFFIRLPSLSPGQRAMAVHFGHFPEDFRPAQVASNQYASAAPVTSQTSTALQAGRPDASQTPLGTSRSDARRAARSVPRARVVDERQRYDPRDISGRGRSRTVERVTQPSAESTRTAAEQQQRRRPTTQSVAAPPPIAAPPPVAAPPPAVASRWPVTQQPQSVNAGPTMSAPSAGTRVAQAPAVSLRNPDTRASAPPPATGSNVGNPVATLPVESPVASQPQGSSIQLAEARPMVPQPSPGPTASGATAPFASVQPSLGATLPSPPVQPGFGTLAPSPSPAAGGTISPLQPVANAAPAASEAASAPASGNDIAGVQQPSRVVALELPPSAPAQPATTQPAATQPATAPSAGEPAARSFADIAAAIASLPGEAGATPPAAAEPERKVVARLEPPKVPAAKPQPKPPLKEAASKPPVAAKEVATKKQLADAESAIKQAAAKGTGAKGAKDAAAAKGSPAKKDAAADKETAKKQEPAAKEPSRHWVQIAGGANDDAMNSEFKRLKGKAPKLLASRTAWTTPLRATNRLLVGPFKTPKEAQDFVNELAKLDLSAFSWTSPAGQEIVKLASK